MVQAERVIWKQQTRRGKERGRLKLGRECRLALKFVKMLLQIEWKKGWCGKLRKEMWLKEIRAEWVHPRQSAFFFFPQSNRRPWEEIHRQVTQAPQSSQDYWDRGNIWKNDRSLSSNQCKLTHLPGCISRQEINLLKWKVVVQKRRGEWNETKGYLAECKEGIFRHQTEWFTEQLLRGNLRALSDGEAAWVWDHRLGLVNTEPQSTREYSERGRCPAERPLHHYVLRFNWLCASSFDRGREGSAQPAHPGTLPQSAEVRDDIGKMRMPMLIAFRT